jgi:hypothetical protein
MWDNSGKISRLEEFPILRLSEMIVYVRQVLSLKRASNYILTQEDFHYAITYGAPQLRCEKTES